MDDKTIPDLRVGLEPSEDGARIASAIVGLDHGTDPFVAAVRATRMPMIITNPRMPDNPVVFANDAFCRLTGYRRDEIVGRNCRFLQGPDSDPAVIRRLHDAVRAARSIEVDIRNYRKDGEAFWNRLLLAPVNDAHGELAYFFASQVDVTLERERMAGLEIHNAALMAELAGRLREQQERESELRFALDAGRLGAWTLDTRPDELMTPSPGSGKTLGRDPGEPLGSAASIHPDDRRRVKEAVERCIATGTDYDIQYRVLDPQGETRWIAVRARPVHGAEGAVTRLSGVSQDITEQKRAEQFQEALGHLDAVIRVVPDAADIAVAAGKIVGEALGVTRAGYGTVDTAAETIAIERDWQASGYASIAGVLRFRAYGRQIEDLAAGRTVLVADAVADPRTSDSFEALRSIDALAFISQPVIEEGRLVAVVYVANARPRAWQADEIAFVAEAGHRIRGAMERRRAEQELAALAASLEHQVAERTRDLMAAEEALRQSQKLEAIGQLTGGVAHDFNNLLTVIRSSVDLMRRPNLPEERRKRYIDAISETVTRASRLTGQLLAFARRQALKPEVFDLRDRLSGIAEMLDTVMGARIVVAMNVPGDPCFVRADASQFETALVNMAVNARDAMDGTGVLTLRLTPAGPMPPVRGHAGAAGRFAAVSMTDTGSGIPSSEIRHIFEPFFTTKEVGKGTGLGLSQVFGFAKQSGGDVNVESQEGRGATFTLYLPEIDPPADVEPSVEDGQASGPVPGGAGRRVLVVEDNLEVGRFSTQLLQDLGYETLWATNAEDAMVKLRAAATSFDIVFSDVVMPGKSGIELAKDIRQSNPGLPVILTSGYSHVLAEEGAHGFELLHKPYSAEQLSRVLRRAILRGPAARRRMA